VSWTVRAANEITRDLNRLPPQVVEEAIAIMEDLTEDPFPPGHLKMGRYGDHYRIRFGSGNLRQRRMTVLRGAAAFDSLSGYEESVKRRSTPNQIVGWRSRRPHTPGQRADCFGLTDNCSSIIL
jgi:hypothetical protein